MLRVGGKRGHRGGSGRPKDVVRAACRMAFDDRLPRLMALADSEDDAVSMKAIDMLARYGGMVYTETEETGRSLLDDMLAAARAAAGQEPQLG